MKKMKIFLLLCLMFLISVNLAANDYEFRSQGGHIVPMNVSDIVIKSEKIHFKMESVKADYGMAEGMTVTVKFVFDSPEAGERYIGFITPESAQEEWLSDPENREEANEDYNFRNFKTSVNGKNVSMKTYKLTDFLPKDIKQLEEIKKYFKEYDKAKAKADADYYRKSYVYFFKANFKKGENVVEHSYHYGGIVGSISNDFNYVWTTISKWKNQKVDDFEVIVEPGNAFIEIPEIKMKNGKRVDWELIGEGNIDYGYKKYDGDNVKSRVLYAKLKKGYLRFKTKDFSPKDEFRLREIRNLNLEDYFPEKTEKGFRYTDDLMQAAYNARLLKEDELKKISDADLNIMKNYPYALKGYDFSDKKLKDYFSKFLWYVPIGKNVELYENDYEVIKDVEKIIKSRKK